MKDLFGQETVETAHQGDLLAGGNGLGVEAVARIVDGIEYVRTESGYYVRADGTGPLLVDLPGNHRHGNPEIRPDSENAVKRLREQVLGEGPDRPSPSRKAP